MNKIKSFLGVIIAFGLGLVGTHAFAQSASSTEIAEAGTAIISAAWGIIIGVFTDMGLVTSLVLLGLLMFVIFWILGKVFAGGRRKRGRR